MAGNYPSVKCANCGAFERAGKQHTQGGSAPFTPPPGTTDPGWAPPTNHKRATTALVLGIVSFVCCGVILGPAAMIEGTKARREIRESNGALTGDGLALAGIILGGIGAALSLLWIIVTFALGGDSGSTRY